MRIPSPFFFAVILCLAVVAYPQTTAFTYQGRISDNNATPTGNYQMQFALYDAAAGGSQIGQTVENVSVNVLNGVFTVELDFGAAAFAGAQRYLEVRVRRSSIDTYTALSPRSRVTSVPVAVQALSAGPDLKLKQLGAMRWDQLKGSSFTPLSGLSGIAFDGTDLWVTRTNNTVSKMRTSDLTILGTYTVGSDPRGMASDGTNIWVANFGSNSVTKVRASDGAIQGTFPVGSNPIAIAFDGTNIWVANNGGSNMTALRASDGSLVSTVATTANLNSILFDGTFIWTGGPGGVSRYFNGSLSFTVPRSANGIAFDGSHIWTSPGASNIDSFKISNNGTQLEFIFVGSNNGSAIVYDGRNIWLATSAPAGVQRFSPTTPGANQKPANYTLTGSPRGMAFDGSDIWVATHLGIAKYSSCC